ncbi:protein turtle homolog B [Egretta garzetta]|uniref:protein turtle homolog B n=1 Tax=Egretta garzetta TaxID=188379 RepID=UPI00163BF30B|nr:protein turtle homolog B [Egretta garzetta]
MLGSVGGISHSFFLHPLAGALGSREEPEFVTARAGESVILGCDVIHPLTGQPPPYVVEWFKFGVPIPIFIKFGFYPPHVDPEYAGPARLHDKASLRIEQVRSEDQGWYECKVLMLDQQYDTFHNGSWVHLTVNGPPFIVSPPENITVNISQDALFTCQAEAYPGNLTYLWYWEEENVYFKNDLKLRVRILIDGTLIIFRVKPEDAGKYTCIPSNSLGRSPSASAYLTVQYPARVVNMPPVIYVPIGIHGYIRCPVEAEPPVTLVKWNKDGRPLRIEKYSGWNLLEDGSIRIEEATEDALGTYTCVPYNALGTMGQSPPARLVLKDPPYFTVLPGWEYRQEAGRELLIPCAAAGDPFPIIAWRKVGKPSRSKHNTLPGGTLQIRSLGKDDHGEWECVATNVVASITASTHLTVVGTSPHAPTSVHVVVAMTSANVSWEPGYDGGYEQTFSVWYGPLMKRAQFGPHDWLSLPVPAGSSWLLVDTLEPETAYQFSVLAQNKLGTSSFSEVVTVNTLAFPVTTPEPLVLVTPPRCLTANRTQQGVLLSWLPPANHSFPIDRYIMEFRVAERWEILDDGILGTENEFFAKDLSQDTWYEFRVLAVMQDLISEPSNVAGVSSTDVFPQPDLTDEGLARPVLAGIVATICFLAAAILFSTLAACFVNKQRKRKLKRKKDPPLSITHCRKSLESPLSSGKVSPESIRTLRPPSESSDDQGPQAKRMLSPTKEKELSLYKKTKRAISSKKYSVSKAEAEAEATTPIELISRGPEAPPSSLQVVPASYPGILPLEAPKSWTGKSPGRGQPSVPTTTKWQDKPMQPMGCQGQLRHTSQGMGIPVLPYHEPSEPVGPSGTSTFSLDTRWYEPQPRPRPSPRQVRRAEPSLHQVVLQPSRLSPLTQSPLSSRNSSPELTARARPRPGIIQQAEVSEITLQPPAAVSFSRKSTPSTGSPAPSSRGGSPSYRPTATFASLATGYTRPPARRCSPAFGEAAGLESLVAAAVSSKRPSPSGDAAAPERLEALKYQRIKKPKKSSKGLLKSRKQSNGSASQVQHLPSSQVLWPDEAVCLRKKKRHPRQDPFARLSALKDDLCHRCFEPLGPLLFMVFDL